MSAAAILLAYAGGLGCAPFLSPSPLLPLFPLLAAGAWFLLRRHRGGRLCLAACFFLLGFAAYHQQLTPPDRPPHIRAFISDHPLVIEGELLAISPRYPSGANLDLQAHLVGSQGIAAPVRGRVRLLVEDELPAARAGDRLRLRTRLRAPRLFGTPGEFNYPRFLAARGIFVTGFIPAARDIAIFPQGATSFEGWRQRIGRGIEAAVDPSLAPLVRALVIGDKGGITPEQRQLLARGGISHLFAISGLHLGLIALFLYGLARSLYGRSERLLLWTPPRRCLPLLLLPLLFSYLQLTGDALPTRRAFLMAAVGALLLLWRRRTPPLRLLAAAALALLLVSPLALFEPSFQLSFAGLLGILLLVPPWAEKVARLPRLCRSPLLLLLTTAAATVATAPFALWQFHLLAPAGLLLNMAAVPAIGFLAVPLGLAGALFLPWWSAASAVLFGGCAQVLRVTLESCAWMVSFPWLAGWQMYLSPPRLTAAFLLAGGFLLLGRGKSWRPASLLIAGAIVLLALPAAAPSGLTVTVLSVGQGDALLLSRPGARHYLVDGGGMPGGSFDVGERLVAPALGWLGVRALEAVILTHDHPDHRLGLLAVLASFPIGEFWTGHPPEELDPDLLRLLRQRQIPVRRMPPGWTHIDSELKGELSIFTPRSPLASLNDASLVVRASCGPDQVLLTGDLERAGVEELLEGWSTGQVGLLKLPHHGSRHSQPQLLLDILQPQAAFVSLGAGNPHRFPHPEVVGAVTGRDIPLYRTDTHGSLRFHTGGTGWQAQTWRHGVFR